MVHLQASVIHIKGWKKDNLPSMLATPLPYILSFRHMAMLFLLVLISPLIYKPWYCFSPSISPPVLQTETYGRLPFLFCRRVCSVRIEEEEEAEWEGGKVLIVCLVAHDYLDTHLLEPCGKMLDHVGKKIHISYAT